MSTPLRFSFKIACACSPITVFNIFFFNLKVENKMSVKFTLTVKVLQCYNNFSGEESTIK